MGHPDTVNTSTEVAWQSNCPHEHIMIGMVWIISFSSGRREYTPVVFERIAIMIPIHTFENCETKLAQPVALSEDGDRTCSFSLVRGKHTAGLMDFKSGIERVIVG